jgi:hypothetical protein
MPLTGDRHAVDSGTVGAAQILDKPATGFPVEPGVMTRNLWVVKDKVAIVSTSEEKTW